MKSDPEVDRVLKEKLDEHYGEKAVSAYRVRLFADNRWAEFDGPDKEQKWSAPLANYPDGEVLANSYRYLLSQDITTKEALEKLRMIRQAQRMANAADKGVKGT